MSQYLPCRQTRRPNFQSVIQLFVASIATVSTVAAIAAQTQLITMGTLDTKTYGDAPFTVSASASSGLPITKWESSDPRVAEVSSSGLVTIIGAGQTSIIASNTGNTTYSPGWVARSLDVALSTAALPTGPLTVTYDTTAKDFDTSTLPSGQATEITYRDTTLPNPATSSQVVYQNGPDILPLSYYSTPLAGSQLWGLAKYVKLGGTGRKLSSCDTTLVTYAKYSDYQTWATTNPNLVLTPSTGVSIPGNSGGYYHPVTLSFYEYGNDSVKESYRLLTTQTVQALIPWRPLKLADGVSDYVNKGYAFRVLFNFPDGVILPDNVWIGVSFNTSANGTFPIGTAGPYDALNISRMSGSPIAAGVSNFSNGLIYKDWRWQSLAEEAPSASYGPYGPVLRLRTTQSNETNTAPVNAGDYEVKTQAAQFSADSKSTSRLVINKAALKLNLTNLTQIRDGKSKPVSVSTIPANISTQLSYAGSNIAPATDGFYPVVASSLNPNYEGQTSATLHIGDTYESWQSATFAASGLLPEQTSDTSDPDGDGLSNLLEYASNLNPLAGEQSSAAAFEANSDTVAFTYRKNMHALDLTYTVENSTQMTDPSSWAPITPLSETTVSDDGSTRVIRATISKPIDMPDFFMRLKINR